MNKEIEENKKEPKMSITGANLLIMVFYTIILCLFTNGFFLDAFFLFIHFFTCLIVAIADRSKMWLLSAVLVLALGFSTCVGIGYLKQP
jgi:hypothetical protein